MKMYLGAQSTLGDTGPLRLVVSLFSMSRIFYVLLLCIPHDN